MRLNNRQRIVLMGVLRDQQGLAEMLKVDSSCLSRSEQGRLRLRKQHALAGLIPMNLAGWIGRAPTNSEFVLFHREYLRLEDMGLIERCNLCGGRRTSHLRLTAAGLAVAEELLERGRTLDDEASESIDLEKIEFLPIAWPQNMALQRDPE